MSLKLSTYHYLYVNSSNKRYSIIDQHLARHFKYNGECLSSPPPFLGGQIITPFLIQWCPPIKIQGCNYMESVYPYSSSILEFLL